MDDNIFETLATALIAHWYDELTIDAQDMISQHDLNALSTNMANSLEYIKADKEACLALSTMYKQLNGTLGVVDE